MKDKSMPLASNNHKKSTHISVLTKHLHSIELKVSKITNTIMQRKTIYILLTGQVRVQSETLACMHVAEIGESLLGQLTKHSIEG